MKYLELANQIREKCGMKPGITHVLSKGEQGLIYMRLCSDEDRINKFEKKKDLIRSIIKEINQEKLTSEPSKYINNI